MAHPELTFGLNQLTSNVNGLLMQRQDLMDTFLVLLNQQLGPRSDSSANEQRFVIKTRTNFLQIVWKHFIC